MKQSNLYIPTAKEVTNQAVCASHRLALRAGYIYQTAAGIYSYLPLATMLLENIKEIIREELMAIGANEVILPLLEPAHLWEQTGRWQGYGSELFRVTDRKETSYALAPTHEEVITDLVKNYLVSYKKYPLNLFQIGTKMRDEARPRFGLLRGREFIMMDGYSFHTSLEDLDKTYQDYYQAYKNIFNRLGLDVKVVAADNGKIGGSSSHEFMALADIGEDTICYVDGVDTGYNLEIAPVYYQKTSLDETKITQINKVATPGLKKCEEVCSITGLPLADHVKSICVKHGAGIAIILVAANRTLNEIKAAKILDEDELIMATAEDLAKYGLIEGFIGPLNLAEEITIIADQELIGKENIVVGANEEGFHLTGVNLSRDLENVTYHDLRNVEEGDYLQENLGPVKFKKGIEIGHIFALGDKYTKDLEVSYLDENQSSQVPVMGCYGIGVSRLLSAIIEQNYDENGIILPPAIAPFKVHLVVLDYNRDTLQQKVANDLASEFEKQGISVLIDDRDVNPGTKFKESDLIGMPIRITLGRKLTDNIVEVKFRNKEQGQDVNLDQVVSLITDELKK